MYPDALASVAEERIKRKPDNRFELSNFAVNLPLSPGSASAPMHSYSNQVELIGIVDGTLTVGVGTVEHEMNSGDCIGINAGIEEGLQNINRCDESAACLAMDDRTVGDQAEFPEDDRQARQSDNGNWILTRNYGESY